MACDPDRNSHWQSERCRVGVCACIPDPADSSRQIVLFWSRYGLPSVVSATGTYWFFGPGQKPGDVAVTVGVDGPTLKQFFAESQLVATVGDPWSVMEERAVPIFIARRPFKTLQQVWPSLAGRN